MKNADFHCDFGSGARLGIGINSHHAVIGIIEDGKHARIALTPDSLAALGLRLIAIANTLRGAPDAQEQERSK